MRHRCRCTVSRTTRIRLFPLFFHNGCSQSSRFPTAGQGERSSGKEIVSLQESHLPTAHAYADDTQLYLSFSPSDGTGELDAVTAIENCIRDIRQWICVRKLMLNDDKTEFLLVGTRKQLTKVSIDGVRVGEIISVLHQSVIWAHGLTRIWIWMYILPKHAAVHFIIFIISDILGSTYPEVAPKH